jgi:hypothetical protein
MTVFIQLLLAVIITTLTFMLVMVGIQVFHLLHDFRQAVKKLNRILDNTREISDTVTRPVVAVNQFFSDVKNLVDSTRDQMIADTPDKVISEPHVVKEPKGMQRFFKRSGLPLRPS